MDKIQQISIQNQLTNLIVNVEVLKNKREANKEVFTHFQQAPPIKENRLFVLCGTQFIDASRKSAFKMIEVQNVLFMAMRKELEMNIRDVLSQITCGCDFLDDETLSFLDENQFI